MVSGGFPMSTGSTAIGHWNKFYLNALAIAAGAKTG
jgi:hypothetical protein